MRSYLTGLALCAGACGVILTGAGRRAGDHAPPPGPALVAEPDPAIPAISARTAAKQRLADHLIAGRLRLADAAAAALDLNRDWPPVPPHWYDTYPGRSLAERVARVLVAMVELQLPADDPRRAGVLGRLAGELDALAAAAADEPAVAAAVVAD